MTWDGKPQNPERDGWHWLAVDDSGEPCAFYWSGRRQEWLADDVPDRAADYREPARMAEIWETYLGPCLPPAEVAARCDEAARAEREAAARVCDARSIMWMDHGGSSAMSRENEAGACAAAIRARGEPQR